MTNRRKTAAEVEAEIEKTNQSITWHESRIAWFRQHGAKHDAEIASRSSKIQDLRRELTITPTGMPFEQRQARLRKLEAEIARLQHGRAVCARDEIIAHEFAIASLREKRAELDELLAETRELEAEMIDGLADARAALSEAYERATAAREEREAAIAARIAAERDFTKSGDDAGWKKVEAARKAEERARMIADAREGELRAADERVRTEAEDLARRQHETMVRAYGEALRAKVARIGELDAEIATLTAERTKLQHDLPFEVQTSGRITDAIVRRAFEVDHNARWSFETWERQKEQGSRAQRRLQAARQRATTSEGGSDDHAA
jgi:hypothetical protein